MHAPDFPPLTPHCTTLADWGSWYAGVVCGHGAAGRVDVRYDTLTEFDDVTNETTPYSGSEPVRNIRPEPARLTADALAAWAESLTPGGALQLMYHGGWWDVVLLAKHGEVFEVEVEDYDVVHKVGVEALRPSPNWQWDAKVRAWKQASAADGELSPPSRSNLPDDADRCPPEETS